jgi:hypothetical protein
MLYPTTANRSDPAASATASASSASWSRAEAFDTITTEIAPGSVHLRLRGRDPDVVVTPPPAERPASGPAAQQAAPAVDEAMGALQLRGTHGEVSVGRVLDGLLARNAYGGVRVDELVAGACDVATTYGEIEIGIAEGTAAWLDIASDTGSVHNRLDEQPGPDAFDRTCEINARTRDGDIVIRRARRPAEAKPRFWSVASTSR